MGEFIVHAGWTTLCYALVLPGRKSAFRAGFWPDCYRENTEIHLIPGSSPAKILPGRPISGSKALLHNLEYRNLFRSRVYPGLYTCMLATHFRETRTPVVFKSLFYCCPGLPLPGVPEEGPGLADRGFWAGSGPDPGGLIYV